MKNLLMAIAAFFGFGVATAQEAPKPKQKPRTTSDTARTTKPRKTEKGGVKKMDTAAQKTTTRQKTKKTADTVSVKKAKK